MSLEDFQILDNEPFDNIIKKRDYTKICHQQGAQLNQSDQNIEFSFSENKNYHQIGKGYLEINITVRKNDTTTFHYEDSICLVNNGYAFCFKEDRLTTTIVNDIECNIFCGQVSTIMKVISNKDEDLLTQFDNFNENDIPILSRFADLPTQLRSTPHPNKRMFLFRRYFWILQNFQGGNYNLGFHLMFKTANLQDVIYTSMDDDINVSNISLYLCIPN